MGINKTIRPSVIMKLYKDGYDVSGSEVKLGDPITMLIEMAGNFKGNNILPYAHGFTSSPHNQYFTDVCWYLIRFILRVFFNRWKSDFSSYYQRFRIFFFISLCVEMC